tara:strand:- start:2309 stop:3157 length:849 start_codon:yes stop_codon:yes gene_type:complete
MKILILGSTGILGNSLTKYLKTKKVKLFFISRKKNFKKHFYLKDFSNYERLKELIFKIKPNYIINCLGVTKFHNSYKDKKETKKINIKLPIFLSNFCLEEKIYFLHISTDCVFLGTKGNYKENAKKDAKDLYGLSKNLGEVKNKFSTTIRTSFIGPEKNTNKSLLNWFLSQSNSTRGYTNAFFSGLTSLELSKIIFKFFIKKNNLYNLVLHVGGFKISKYNLLIIIKKIFKKKINIVRFKDFKIDRSLNSKKFQNLTKYKIKSWTILVKELKAFMLKNSYNF